MKSNISRVCLLSLFIIFLSSPDVHSSDNKWDIKIELSKQEYVLHEPIWLDVTITNKTSDTLRTHGLIAPNQFHFYIVLVDSDGMEIEYTGLESLMAWGVGKLLLGAGEQDYASFSLPELFGAREFKSDYRIERNRFAYIPTGTYTVKVYYESDPSNDITFSVVEPSGQEKEVLRKMEEANRIWRQTDTDPSSQVYGEVPRDFPNSVFAEECYNLFRFFSNEIFNGIRNHTYDKRILKREMLSKYPNSGHAKEWISSITFGKSEDEQITFYDELIEESPDTRASKVASLLKKRLLAKRGEGK